MHQAIKGALIGGAVGGGVAAFQASRQSPATPAEPLVGVVARGAAQGALVGGAVGLLLELRAGRRRRAAARLAESRRGVRNLADRAKPVLASVVDELIELEETVRPALSSAAERAAGLVNEAVSDLEPHVRHAAERAADAARPTADAAAEAARDAAARAEAAAGSARDRAATAAEAARDRAARAQDAAQKKLEVALSR